MHLDRPFLGSGWRFPVQVNASGGLAWSAGEQDIQEAIWIVLGTARGEREMRPQFGCGIHELVFAPKSTATLNGIAHAVQEALTRWEPRIDVLDVRVTTSPDGEDPVLVDVDYRIRANNAFGNLVYPFYVREGVGA
jgi:uncharacterized protein